MVMQIAIVILHYGSLTTTRKCLDELKKKIGPHSLILVNNTKDDLGELAKIIQDTKLINNSKNVGFARGVNQGIKLALENKSVGAVLLMNNDLSIESGSLEILSQTFALKNTAGIVSPVLAHSHGLFDWGGKFAPWTGMVKHRNFEQKPKTVLTVDHVAGAAMLIARELFERIGYFDERFFLYYEDLDFCLRAKKAGYTIHINPQVTATHAISSSSRALPRTIYQWKSHFLFTLKHFGRTVYLTAFLFGLVFYPLVILKISLQNLLGKKS